VPYPTACVAAPILLRRRVSTAHDPEGAQSRYRVVCDGRWRVAAAPREIRAVARAGEFRRIRAAAATAFLADALMLRKEDARLLRGRARFVDKLQLDRMAHGAFVRSPLPHAEVVAAHASPPLDAGRRPVPP